ncbi:MAG TPA: right-handed parallel beta-helix repeat-containing protein, partial [Spirochaetota bacterium]|nr:right-handed parallel beta-helix repeat-containing protein [Spirochaetota bacterium]
MALRSIHLFFRALVVMIPALCVSCGEGCNNTRSVYYALTVLESANGTIVVDPVRSHYKEGFTVRLTAIPADGYALYSWSGDTDSGENPLPLVMDSDKAVGAEFVQYHDGVYYVDYESGSDGNSGLAESAPWKHAPGDPEAENNPAAVELLPGDRVLFRGGVAYRGNIAMQAGGAFGHPITYRGDAWPAGQKAVIDGSDLVEGWTACGSAEECFGAENFGNIYYAYIPADADPLSLNLHEDDDFLWPAQDPDPAEPFFYDDADGFRTVTQDNLTRTSLADDEYFTQEDESYWDDSYLLVWVNPNIVVTVKILSYDPAAHRVTFDDLGENAIYPDGRDQAYAVFNSPHALDGPGEYFASSTPDENGLKILLWPRSAVNLGERISRSVRSYGIDVNTRSNAAIQGFEVRNHCGTGLRDGVGIGTISAAHIASYNLTIKDNYITHNRKGGSSGGYGGIFIGECYGTLVEGNEIVDNPRQAGIFFGGGARITARDNIITRSGGTSLRFYGVEESRMTGNTITDSNGSHANGITLYLGCKNILVANNRVLDSGSPITFQDSGNLWFVNNLVDACDRESNVNEWGDTSHGPWARGVIAFFNNTLVRNNRNASLNIGDNPGKNAYYSMNNIIDGGGNASCVRRSHNLYTGLSWSQDEYYGWELAEGEAVEEDLADVFDDPASLAYTLLTGGPAAGAGRDLMSLVPAELFSDFDFESDIDG